MLPDYARTAQYAARLGTANRRQAEDRVVFAILSASSDFDATCGAFTLIRTSWRAAPPRTLRRLIVIPRGRYGAVQYAPRKAQWISRFARMAREGYDVRRGNETCHQHRIRLWADVPGLGLAKASFASALMEPLTSTVACIDRHIARRYGIEAERGFKTRADLGVYRNIERRLQARGQRRGVSAFVAQWAEWDAQRESAADHACLA